MYYSRDMAFLQKFPKVPLKDVAKADIKFPDLSLEGKALASQFATLGGRLDEAENLEILNSNLRTKTFVTGHTPAKVDLDVFARVLPLARQWPASLHGEFRHILRWADLVQNTLVEVPQDEALAVDLNAEVPREVKKKEKKEAPKAAPKEAKEAAKAKGELSEEQKKASAEAAKAKKAAKAKAKAEQQAKVAAAAVPPNPGMVDLRVGFIQKAEKHPDADSLYVSTIDMGDAEGPRTVCSGLVKYIPLEQMQQRFVVVVANLKPVTMRGIKLCAMVLCALNEETVEFVNPPEGSKPGDKIFFEGYDAEPEKQLAPKKKVWETIQPLFSTTPAFEVTYTEGGKVARLVNGRGELCRNSTIVGAKVN